MTEENCLNATLEKLNSTFEQQTATAVSGLTLPQFTGLHNEDVHEFISKFKLATFVLSDKHRCLALNKCLAGTANTWAKANIKRALAEGQWKVAKKALIDRFGPSNLIFKHRELLNNMSYQGPQSITLLGYIEKFISLYKKAYNSQSDKDAIMSLRLNLPNHIIRNLNLLDDGWTSYNSCSELYKLVRRYEENIMPFEQSSQPQVVLDQNGIKELLTQLRQEFRPQQQLLGALKTEQLHTDKPDLDRYRYQPRQQFYKRKYQNNRRQFQSSPSDPNKPRLQIENNNELDKNKQVTFAEQPSGSRPVFEPNSRSRKPPSPCFYCGNDHWNSDCPKRANYLN